jgi:hypothetical protein
MQLLTTKKVKNVLFLARLGVLSDKNGWEWNITHVKTDEKINIFLQKVLHFDRRVVTRFFQDSLFGQCFDAIFPVWCESYATVCWLVGFICFSQLHKYSPRNSRGDFWVVDIKVHHHYHLTIWQVNNAHPFLHRMSVELSVPYFMMDRSPGPMSPARQRHSLIGFNLVYRNTKLDYRV